MPMDISDKSKSWRNRLKKPREEFNPNEEIQKEKEPSKDDIRLTHPENKSTIQIKDDGSINLFASNNTGIKIDPNTESIQFYGEKGIFKLPKTHFITENDGFKWNYCPMNEDLQDPFRELVTTKLYGTQLLEKMLNTTGMYANGAGPVAPAGASALLQMIDLQGTNAYKNKIPPEAQKMLDITSGVTNILKDIGIKFSSNLT